MCGHFAAAQVYSVLKKAEIEARKKILIQEIARKILGNDQVPLNENSILYKIIDDRLSWVFESAKKEDFNFWVDNITDGLTAKDVLKLSSEFFEDKDFPVYKNAFHIIFDVDPNAEFTFKNLYYHDELKSLIELSHLPSEPLEELKDANAEVLKKDASQKPIYFIVDEGHWNPDYLKKVRKMISLPEIDWVAIEMIPASLQEEVDVYIQSTDESSSQFKNAERKLKEYFANVPDLFFKKDGEPSFYFTVLKDARKYKKRLIALDVDTKYIALADSDGEGVSMIFRNSFWASRIPTKGRGIIYGGNDHFYDNRSRAGTGVQNYLKRKGYSDYYRIRSLDDLEVIIRDDEYSDLASPPPGFFDDK